MDKLFLSGNRDIKEMLEYAAERSEEINGTGYGNLSRNMSAEEWDEWEYKMLTVLDNTTTVASNALADTAKVGMEARRLLVQR